MELLGLDDRAAGETEILSLTVEALRAAGLKDFSMRSAIWRCSARWSMRWTCRRNGARA